MSWRDREHNQGGSGGAGALSGVVSLLNGCVPLGRWFGVRVRLHASLILFILLTLVFSPSGSKQVRFADVATAMGLLFGIVLLHEFGHCIGAKLVGGRPEEIILSPLGGLASAPVPHRAGANFIVSAGGPIVNVLICGVTGVALWYLTHGVVPLNPFHPAPPESFYRTSLPYYLWWTFSISYILLLFNLLPIYPLDGGQLLQAMMWPKMGYARSMEMACVTGMAGAVGLAVFGLVAGQLLLILIAAFGFLYCYQRRMAVREAGAEGLAETTGEYGAGAVLEPPPPQPAARKRRLSRRAFRKIQKLAEAERREQARIDAILEKVSQHGMHSLYWWERRTLHKATARQRQADWELTRAYRET